MSGNIWMFSDMIDDEDIEMLQKDFITYYEGADYYGLGPIIVGSSTMAHSLILPMIGENRWSSSAGRV
jgi:hypothetical protein